ncbi:MAG: CotH kinase family protein [Firmicutes bacterium]|nr:CotH kinase family protein [Bacillota bacterium]
MSTHKHIEIICIIILLLTVFITVLFVNSEKFGVKTETKTPAYTESLFDTTKVHTIDIVVENKEDFIANCKSEEYYLCDVTIDGETIQNAAIRGKGNTSLTQVDSYENDRYSFKLEFDHYNNGQTFQGLDKLCLNNIIQDHTYMKEFITYQMMNSIGAATPLCSYAYITLNGEEWGLYLAVESVEESFLERNFGSDYGELYKPDSMDMGGGRGNGRNFEQENIFSQNDENTKNNVLQNEGAVPAVPQQGSETAETESLPNSKNQTAPSDLFSSGMNSDGLSNDNAGNQTPPSPPQNGKQMTMPPDIPQNREESAPPSLPEEAESITPPDIPENAENEETQIPLRQGNVPNGMSSEDVLLKYTDENPESYSNIFDNAKTDITNSDQTRLIEALRNLNSGKNIEDTVDTDAVIRYFAVHNFVLNFDSYTGSMIHNYYLYEKDGQLIMIPWDYNLAFGGFMSGGDATSLINYDIDNPVSGLGMEERPMLNWIFQNDAHIDIYHRYLDTLVSTYFDNGTFSDLFEDTKAIIAPYVEKDPTKFCTYEEFEQGAETLKEFCLLRAESIRSQLQGDNKTIDASHINISDMGSMGMGKKE